MPESPRISKQEAEFIEFVTKLPSDVNAYAVVADHLEDEFYHEKSPPWSRRLRLASLVLYQVMFFQALCLLYKQFSRKWPAIKFNEIGLVLFDLSYTAGIGLLLNAGVTIYVLSMQYTSDLGHRINVSRMILLFGLKFIPIALAAWALTWFAACQCALRLWNSNAVHNMNRNKLKTVIQWALSTFFVIAAFAPLPAICWTVAELSLAFSKVETLADDVISALRSKVESYDPQDYNKLGLLTLLLPARALDPLIRRAETFARRQALIYCIVICLLLLVHGPLLWISLQGLYNQSKNQRATEAPWPKGLEIGRMSRELRRERRWIVNHALCVFLSTIVHLPPVLWQLAPHPPGFFQTPKFRQINYHFLTFPLAITGNIILLLLNVHARRAIRHRKKLIQQENALPAPLEAIGVKANDEINISLEKPEARDRLLGYSGHCL